MLKNMYEVLRDENIKLPHENEGNQKVKCLVLDRVQDLVLDRVQDRVQDPVPVLEELWEVEIHIIPLQVVLHVAVKKNIYVKL